MDTETYEVPSVFMLFLRLFEMPHMPRSLLDPSDVKREQEWQQEERKRHAELYSEVAQRKKTTNEQGIKLTVVLMASRRMLQAHSLLRHRTH